MENLFVEKGIHRSSIVAKVFGDKAGLFHGKDLDEQLVLSHLNDLQEILSPLMSLLEEFSTTESLR